MLSTFSVINWFYSKLIKFFHLKNSQVVLEGVWQEGFMALAAVGATNIGSIKVCPQFLNDVIVVL